MARQTGRAEESRLDSAINDEPVESDGKAHSNSIVVEQVDGPSLLLKALGQGRADGPAPREVIAVEQAVDFFGQKIKRSPARTRSAFAMLACFGMTSTSSTWPSANYNEAIRLDPRSAANFAGRAAAWSPGTRIRQGHRRFRRGHSARPEEHRCLHRTRARPSREEQYTQAIADFSEAIWLDPLSTAAFCQPRSGLAIQAGVCQGHHRLQPGPPDRSPSGPPFIALRGHGWEGLRRATQGDRRLRRGDTDRSRRYPGAMRPGLALATCPDQGIRDAKLAVLSATRACELTQWKSRGSILDSSRRGFARRRRADFRVGRSGGERLKSRWPLPTRPARASRTGEARIERAYRAQGFATQRPLRLRPTSLIPFFRPSSLTTSSLAGTVKLLRGAMQIPRQNFRHSSGLLATPSAARPLKPGAMRCRCEDRSASCPCL